MWTTGAQFEHYVIRKEGLTDGPLNVYLGGDGRPFLTDGRVAADPTSRVSVARLLMAEDPNKALYVGRPCYHGATLRGTCDFRWWTTHRYAEEVVESLAAVIRSAAAGREVTLIGFSGGGTLAMALADRVPEAVSIVTVAGNLDVAGWTTHHGYTPLVGHDPAQDAWTGKPQVHFVGELDESVPATLSLQALEGIESARVCVIKGATHTQPWRRLWKDLLVAIRDQNCPP